MSAEVKSVTEASNKCDQDCNTESGFYFDILKSKLWEIDSARLNTQTEILNIVYLKLVIFPSR